MGETRLEATEALLSALAFAAARHSGQVRQKNGEPYINHPIRVAEILARIGKIVDPVVLQAAFLHDVLEDTPTSAEELRTAFGPDVLALVLEVSDDMALPKEMRKKQQLEQAANLSLGAKQIRIADKISNVSDITPDQPDGWTLERKRQYLTWAAEVVAQCQGASLPLEQQFQRVLDVRRAALADPV